MTMLGDPFTPQYPHLVQFECLGALGTGTNGTVWLAWDKVREAHVALKRVRSGEREYGLQSRCMGHPHVMPVLDLVRTRDSAFIVLPVAEGRDLWLRYGDLYQGQRSLVNSVVGPLASALATLHAQGVLHRDVKLENVLLTSEGVVKLSDFGFACEAQRRLSICGTSRCMAPEVALTDPTDLNSTDCAAVPRSLRRGYGVSADVWSFGVLTAELLLSRGFFSRGKGQGSYRDCVAPIYNGDGWGIKEKHSALAEEFVKACLTPDPDKRPTALELYHHPWLTEHMSPELWQQLHPNRFTGAEATRPRDDSSILPRLYLRTKASSTKDGLLSEEDGPLKRAGGSFSRSQALSSGPATSVDVHSQPTTSMGQSGNTAAGARPGDCRKGPLAMQSERGNRGEVAWPRGHASGLGLEPHACATGSTGVGEASGAHVRDDAEGRKWFSRLLNREGQGRSSGRASRPRHWRRWLCM